MQNKKDKIIVLILALIILIGFALRLYRIDYQPIWLDEASAIQVAKQSLMDVFAYDFKYEIHPPLYFLTLHFWMSIFGISELSVRLLSAVFGTASIFLAFLIADYIFGRKTGLISAFIFALSPINIALSQDTKFYTMLPFFVFLSMYFWLRAYRENRNIYWVFFSVCAIFAAYTHYYAALYLLSMGVLFFIFMIKKIEKAALKKWFYSMAAIFIAILPLILVSVQQANAFGTSESLQKNKYYYLLIIPYQFISFLIGEHSVFMEDYKITAYLPLLALILAVFAFFFIRGLIASKEKKEETAVMAFLTIFPLIPIYLLSFAVNQTFVPKRFLFVTAPFFAILAHGMSIKNNRLQALAIIFVAAASSLSLVSYYNAQDREDWRAAASFIRENSIPEDAIIVIPAIRSLPLNYYYKGNKMYSLTTGEASDASGEIIYGKVIYWKTNYVEEDDIAKLDNISGAHRRIWLVESPSHEIFDSKNLSKGYLDKNLNQAMKKSFNFLDIYLYERVG